MKIEKIRSELGIEKFNFKLKYDRVYIHYFIDNKKVWMHKDVYKYMVENPNASNFAVYDKSEGVFQIKMYSTEHRCIQENNNRRATLNMYMKKYGTIEEAEKQYLMLWKETYESILKKPDSKIASYERLGKKLNFFSDEEILKRIRPLSDEEVANQIREEKELKIYLKKIDKNEVEEETDLDYLINSQKKDESYYDPYENFSWGGLQGEEAYAAYWNCD